MGFLSWIKGVFKRMFQPAEVYSIFGVQPAISASYFAVIQKWNNLYQGLGPWNDDNTPSSYFAATVAAEAARLATIEMSIEINGSARADYLQSQINTVKEQLRTQLEYACALGGMIFKPNGTGVDYIQPTSFIPTDVNGNGDITGGIFISQRQDQDKYYNRFEYHRFDGYVYKISNKVYVSDTPDTIGRPTTLAAVPAWAEIQEEISINNLEKPLFTYLKMPWANIIDSSSPYGCSIFAKAVDTIQDIDTTAAGLRHEIRTAKRKLFVSNNMLRRDENGKVVGNPIPDLIQGLEFGINETNTYREFNPQIRIDEYKSSLQTFLNIAGNQCGFSNGYFSFDEKTGLVTATQIEADQQRTISTVTDIQQALKFTLSRLVYALDAYASLYNLAPAGTYEEQYNLKDLNVNITEDRARAWEMVKAGAIPKWKYLVEYEGYTEEEAKQIADEAQRKQMFWQYVVAGKFSFAKYLEMFEGFTEEDAAKYASENTPDAFGGG